MSEHTNNPSREAIGLRELELGLIRREQNLKFANYCPRCDDWMDQQSEREVNHFTCPHCKLIRHIDSSVYNK